MLLICLPAGHELMMRVLIQLMVFLLQCKFSMQRPVDAAANASSLQELEQRKSPAAHADRRPPACNALCSVAPALCLPGPPFARASRWPSTSLSPPKAEE